MATTMATTGPPTFRARASLAQHTMWLASQYLPDRAAFNIMLQLTLDGPLNVPALVGALQSVVDLQATLRTTFAVDGETLIQVIHRRVTIDCPLVDLAALSEADTSAAERDHVRQAGLTPFDLERGPLIRCLLLRLAPGRHRLLVATHHLVADGGSWAPLAEQLVTTYRGDPLPPLPLTFREYSERQHALAESPKGREHAAFWRSRVAALPSAPVLPVDRPRQRPLGPPVSVHELPLPPAVTEALADFRRRYGIGRFRTILAAVVAFLHRLSGEHDLLVGTTLAGRAEPDTVPLVGYFNNAAVLRLRLGGEPSFVEVARSVDAELGRAVEHQGYPFEWAVRQPGADSRIGWNTLRPLSVTREPAAFTIDVGPLHVRADEVHLETAPEDLTLYVQDMPAGLRVVCEFRAERFEAAGMTRWLKRFLRLLERLLERPEQPLSMVPLTDRAEEQQLLTAATASDPAGTAARDLAAWFEEQVARAPEAVAATHGTVSWTYAQLDERSTRMARILRARGVGPDVLVGLCVERGTEMLVGMLAVLKAQGAYLPLAPDDPRERLALLLERARPPVLVTTSRELGNLPPYGGTILTLDKDSGDAEVGPWTAPGPVAGPNHLAYVVFTSGSTGLPKGILTRRHSVARYLGFLHETYHLGPTDVVLQLAPLTFDASVRDTLGPLLAGGRLVIPSQSEAADPDVLWTLIASHGVTCLLSVVPTLLAALVESAERQPRPATAVRLILCSGEALYWSAGRRARDVFGPQVQLVNQYGPSECTMTSTYFVVPGGDDRDGIVPIGRPVPHAQVYVLDRELRLAPLDVPGQLCIGGDGLARGYLDNPDLTAACFVPHPLDRTTGARLYLTGDVGRRRADGTLEWLGRLDDQVKIDGHRVEPGEIEATLTAHPAVRQAVVHSWEVRFGRSRLAAYVVPAPGHPPAPRELRRFLAARLPAAMIPSRFVVLDALPLTAHGKVDRRRLPRPDEAGSMSGMGRRPPTPVEARLADHWREVLAISSVDLDADFFELGGDSLAAARLLARVRGAFEVALDIEALIDAPTVADLAVTIVARLYREHGGPMNGP